MIQFLKNTKIDFMGKRLYAIVISVVFVMLGIIALISIAFGKANLGVDFVGGTTVQVRFAEPVPIHEVRRALTDGGLQGFALLEMPAENAIFIRMAMEERDLGEISNEILIILFENFSLKKPEIDTITEIGPKISERIRNDAMKAIAIAAIGLLMYIGWRFQYKFGIGAIIAVFHDVMVVLGIFFILNKEINLVFVSAMLAIAGYSLTDTVVVFDRIRENIKRMLKEPLTAIVNKSVNDVLARTIITTLTTSFAALSLLLFGGEVIHDFALAILIGIIVGTYSSIFVASSAVVFLGAGRKVKKS